MPEAVLSYTELLEAWPALSLDEKLEGFTLLTRGDAEELFHSLDTRDQHDLISHLPAAEGRLWLRLLAPDDAADVVQLASAEEREVLMALLDEATRSEVAALLAYAEDEAGGLMTTQYARLRAEARVDEAIAYLRRQTPKVENVYYPYVLDSQQRLEGVVSLRELILAPPDKRVRELMRTDVVTLSEEMDQEQVARVFAEHDLTVIPVVDADRRVKGIVTVDDIVDVVREEATEDIQKIGGMQALDAPYFQVSHLDMMRKRIGWLAGLVLMSFLTVQAMQFFSSELQKATVLALFVPLIISTGGNCGSQAATLIVRAIALNEVRLRDWLRVVGRELAVGFSLGAILGLLGLGVSFAWQEVFGSAGAAGDALRISLTIAVSIVGVATWGTLVGSMLPIVLRALRLDPASASAPLVATLVDTTGLVIYFVAALVMLRGTLLA